MHLIDRPEASGISHEKYWTGSAIDKNLEFQELTLVSVIVVSQSFSPVTESITFPYAIDGTSRSRTTCFLYKSPAILAVSLQHSLGNSR